MCASEAPEVLGEAAGGLESGRLGWPGEKPMVDHMAGSGRPRATQVARGAQV